MTYNPPPCLVLKPLIERQEYLLRLMDVDPLNSVPPCSNHPFPLPPAIPLLHLSNSVESCRRRRMEGGFEVRDKDETRTECSGPFGLVISFTFSSLTRSMRSFPEAWGSRTLVWCSFFFPQLSLHSFFSPTPKWGGLSSPDGPHGTLTGSAAASRTD